MERSVVEAPTLNLSGVKLDLHADTREPPIFRGEETDKFTVHEWEELMDIYLWKRCIPVAEQVSEILSRLMGRANDIVKIALRSNPSLKLNDNPSVIFDVLKQHFSEITYSCMPLADFYGTVPVAGENHIDYWVRINKAVDLAQESLKRLGWQIEDLCQEAVMMFVKYCPDAALFAVLKFKSLDKWTASEIQDHLNRYQSELKEKASISTKYSRLVRHAAAHVQVPEANDVSKPCIQPLPAASEVVSTNTSSVDDNCLRTLINLLGALRHNNQTPVKLISSEQCYVR